jgi:adenine phosphoribosyltransferase
MNLKAVTKLIKNYKDFPKSGIVFRDISPVLSDPGAFAFIIDELELLTKKLNYNKILAIDARGFIFASALAYKNRKGLIMCRKANKLPGKLITERFDYEYDKGSISVQKNSLSRKDRVLIVDDVLATGNTALSAIKLVLLSGAKPLGLLSFIELEYLNGRKLLEKNKPDDLRIISLIKIKE